MPIWTALIPGAEASEANADHVDPIEPTCSTAPPSLTVLPLAWWCLQFTPRVALLEEAVVMEWQASERLFGGRHALLRRLAVGAQNAGCLAWASASTALAALALARARTHDRDQTDRVQSAPSERKPRSLDELPLSCLSAVAAHEATLSQMGCRTLGDVRRLPRDGLSRRLGALPLQALDQAWGKQAVVLNWVTLPEVFDERLELPGRVDNALALQHAVDILLLQLCAWLAGRHMGVSLFTLRWQHDGQRRDAERGGQWPVRLATPSRDAKQLRALAAEHLRQVTLIAPVGELALRADIVEPLTEAPAELFLQGDASQSLLQHDALRTQAAQRQQAQALSGLLDKLAARLGAQRVLQGHVQADHRFECRQVWTTPCAEVPVQIRFAPQASQRTARAPHEEAHTLPSPTWLLPTPRPLHLHRARPGLPERPFYQGPLTLLAGPHRVDAGWWAPHDVKGRCEPVMADGQDQVQAVSRDYYLASSEQAGLLWVFKDRQAIEGSPGPWFLHGFFA